MVGQWLGLCASTAVGTTSIPSQGAWIPPAAKKQKNMLWVAPGEKKMKTVKIDLGFRFRAIRGKRLLIWMH